MEKALDEIIRLLREKKYHEAKEAFKRIADKTYPVVCNDQSKEARGH